MNQESEFGETVSVADGDVTVEKSYAADEFPVPAIKFVIRSTVGEAVDVRVRDDIPESFPMDCVGFHPNYENENWTAYKDHRVEFVRTLDPEETVTTVYGIRLDETDVDESSFLHDPVLIVEGEETVSSAVEEVVGADNNEVVREVLAGDRDDIPGMGEPTETTDDSLEADVDAVADPPAADASEDDPLAAAAGDADADDPLAFDDGFDDESDPLATADPLSDPETVAGDPLADSLDLGFDEPAEAPVESSADADEPLALNDPTDDSPADADESVGDDPLAFDDGSDDPADVDAEPATDADSSEESTPLELDDPTDAASVDSETDLEAAASEDPLAASEPEPRSFDADTTAAVTPRDAEADPLRLDLTSTDAAESEPAEAEDASDVVDTADADAPAEAPDSAEVVDSVELADSADIDDAADTSALTAGAVDVGAPAGASASRNGVAAALAEEIRAGRVADDDLAVLREKLDLGAPEPPESTAPVPRSVDVRIRRLQAQMDDLDAYTDALSVFLDEQGTGDEIIVGFREELDSVSGELTKLQSALKSAEADRVDLRDELSETSTAVNAAERRLDELDAVEGRVDDVADRVDGVCAQVDDLEAAAVTSDEFDDLESRLAELGELESRVDDLAALDERVERLESLSERVDELESLHGRVDELAATVDRVDAQAEELSNLSEEISMLDEEMGDVRGDLADLDGDIVEARERVETDVDAVQADLDDVESDIEELKSFRDRLGNAFGTGVE